MRTPRPLPHADPGTTPTPLRPVAQDKDRPQTSPDEQIKVLRKAKTEAEGRVAKVRQQLHEEKAHTKKFQQALAKELGCKLQDLDEAVSKSEGSQYRAQAIAMLKSKNKRLEQQIRKLNNIEGYQSSKDHKDVDAQAQRDIRAMEKQRAAAVEQMGHQLAAAEQEVSRLTKVAKGAKARTAVLQKENTKARGSIKTLLSKTSNDDELVNALRDELRDRKEQMRRMAKGEEAARELTMVKESEQRLQAEVRELRRERDMAGQGVARVEREMEDQAQEFREQIERINRANEQGGKVRMLEVEVRRMQELMDMLRRKNETAESTATAAEANSRELKRRCVDLERKLSQAASKAPKGRRGGRNGGRSGGRDGGGSAAMAEDLEDARNALDAAAAEADAVKRTFQQALAAKDQEIGLFRDMVEEMRAQIGGAPSRPGSRRGGGGGGGGGGDRNQRDIKKIKQLTNDNDFLQQELDDMRERYEDLLNSVQSKKGRRR